MKTSIILTRLLFSFLTHCDDYRSFALGILSSSFSARMINRVFVSAHRHVRQSIRSRTLHNDEWSKKTTHSWTGSSRINIYAEDDDTSNPTSVVKHM